MSLRILFAFLFLPLLIACSGIPQVQPVASTEQINQASRLSSLPEHANIYFARPYEVPEMSYHTIYINDKKVSQLLSVQYTNLKLAPGLYSFSIKSNSPDYPDHQYYNRTISNFDLELEAGSVALLSCGKNSLSGWESTDRFILPLDSCTQNTGLSTINQDGITFCSKKFEVKSELKWHGVVYSKESLENCKLTPNKNIISGQMVLADASQIEAKVAVAANQNITQDLAEPLAIGAQAEFDILMTNANCKVNNTNWAYTGENCSNGLAHGEGSAQDTKGLTFVGTFSEGMRIKGEILQDGNMIFSGMLIDDKPDGSAICFYEGEYEECRFYKGKRIDTLYKIRIENAKIKHKNPMKYASAAPSKDITDHAVDSLGKEAFSQAASFIFDSLF
tara:strand:+ start:201 stop:1373 length:1173 start_codon:yes stop_codon:yes gene_type:complete